LLTRDGNGDRNDFKAAEEFSRVQILDYPRKTQHIIDSGEAVDVVCYTTPSLHSLDPRYIEAILNGAQKPCLSDPLLARIRELHGFRLSNEAKKWYVLNDLGNVQAIGARVAYVTNHLLIHEDLDLKDPYSYPIHSKNPLEILESIT